MLGPDRGYRNTRSDPNNSSVVLRATVAGVRILLPGDAEVEAQDDLLAAGTDLRADILKVPHHGSRYSDPPSCGAVHARLALISVGPAQRLRPSRRRCCWPSSPGWACRCGAPTGMATSR